MADYTTLKVPELKKLLSDRSLPSTGNKPDLIARLQEDDKKKASAPGMPLILRPHPSHINDHR